MPHDLKYGNATFSRGSIPDDEPIMVFRGRDVCVPEMLDRYYELCEKAGSPQKHLNLVRLRQRQITAWQAAHPERTHTPQSANYRANDA